MVGTIIPMGYGDSQRTKYRRRHGVVLTHMAGNLVGAVAFGVVLSGAGALLLRASGLAGRWWPTALALGALGLLYGAHEFGLFRLPAPQSFWQVPARWRTALRPGWSAFLYGVGLGPGVLVAIPFATFYLVLAWALLCGDVALGALCFAVYGAGRATPVLLMFYLCEESEKAFRASEAINLWWPVAQLLNGFALSAAGACLILTGLLAAG